LNHRQAAPDSVQDSGLARLRQDLGLRLDDLRGYGILPFGADDQDLEGEAGPVRLALDLVDALESTQRRVIETSIQILSLRELVAKLLSQRTPQAVAETVTFYVQKAFDHERVLVGVYDPRTEALQGWLSVRDGASECRRFRLEGEWHGSLREALHSGMAVSGNGAVNPFLAGPATPGELAAFRDAGLGSYLAFPLRGAGQKDRKIVGVLMVGRGPGGASLNEMESGILESVVESVGTALENVILEEDVRREEAFRKDIMRSMSSGLVAVDLEGRVLALNACAERLTGFTLAEFRGRPLEGVDPPGGGIAGLLAKTLASRRPILRAERAVRRADGGAFPATCATSLLRNPEGTVYGAVVTFTDLTEIKEMEERIRSLDRLAALGRFTAGIAHEIRNPLTGIGTGVQYLERHLSGDPSQDENLRFIRSEIARLDRIVEDLFRVTHPQPLQRIPEAARGMVERAMQSLGDLPQRKGIQVTYDFPADLPEVRIDPDQIHQVLLNLLKNAVEATPEGGAVAIHGYPAPEETRPQMVVQIVDSGPGIDPEFLPKIFEPFFTRGKPGGTGLGLYVSHGIVERHGGELHAANNNAGGAVFTLKLPLDTLDMTEML